MQKAFHLLPYIIALGAGLLIGYGDLNAKEVQGTVLIILVLTFLFGVLLPRHAWRWALLIGLGVPLINWGGLIFGYHGLPTGLPWHLDTLIALIPAFIGAYCGVGASKGAQLLRHLNV